MLKTILDNYNRKNKTKYFITERELFQKKIITGGKIIPMIIIISGLRMQGSGLIKKNQH